MIDPKSILKHPRIMTRLPRHFTVTTVRLDMWRERPTQHFLKTLLNNTRGRVYISDSTLVFGDFVVGFEDPTDLTFATLVMPNLSAE